MERRLTVPHAAGAEDGTASPAAVAETVASLRHAQRQLARRSRDEIVALLGDVIETWLAPDSRWLARAVSQLPGATGFSAAMIRHALPTMLAPLRRPALDALLEREVGMRRGPQLILHVLPGNLPGLAAIPAALSLAIGSAALLKAGRGDRAFPALFAASIAERDPQLGDCVAALYWPGGERDPEDAALAADLIVASGDDATIAALRARARGRFIGHGHRISFAVVAREVAGDAEPARRTAALLAHDIAMWDQRGCLSPQLCFVEGDRATAQRFAAQVARALEPLAAQLPPAAPSPAERLALRRFRDDAEWRGLGGEPVDLFAAADEASGTVVVESDAALRPSPLCRTLRVQPLPGAGALSALLAPARAQLEGAGLAAAPQRWAEIADCLAAAGVHRVCEIGVMQRPPLDWRQGGRPRVADWLSDA